MNYNFKEATNLTEAINKLSRTTKRHRSGSPRATNRYGHLLNILSHNDGSSASEIAVLMDIRPSSLTEMLNNLENDGLIVRNRDETDKRIVKIFINEAGKNKLEEIHSTVNNLYKNILTPEEEVTFIGLCNKLASNLQQHFDEKCGHKMHKNGKHGCHMGKEKHGHHKGYKGREYHHGKMSE